MISNRTLAALMVLCGMAAILVLTMCMWGTDWWRLTGEVEHPRRDTQVGTVRSGESGPPSQVYPQPLERRLLSGLVLVDSLTGSPLRNVAVRLQLADSAGDPNAQQLTTAESGYVHVEPGSYIMSSNAPIPAFKSAMARVESTVQRLELECIGQLRIEYPPAGKAPDLRIFVLRANTDGVDAWLSRIQSATRERLASVLTATMEEARADGAVLTVPPGASRFTLHAHERYCLVAVSEGDIRVSPGASFWSVGQQVLPDESIRYTVPPSNASICPVSASFEVEPGQEESVRVEALVYHSLEIRLNRLNFNGGRLTLKHAETSPNGMATFWKIHGRWECAEERPAMAKFEGCPPGTYRLTGALWTTGECTFVMKQIEVRDRSEVIPISDCVGPYALDLMPTREVRTGRTADVKIKGSDTDPMLWRLGAATRIELRDRDRLSGLFFRQGTVELRWVDPPASSLDRISFDLDRASSVFY